jgi:adenosine deaminase
MRMFKALHTLYPKVHIALHAGELFPKKVAQHSVQSPIRDAIITGQAERIGHGLDIREEPHPEKLAALMADKGIAVETNLTSNRILFNIAGAQHPLSYYLEHHVPVVLSTDDEGILRTELTNEYFDAVAHYHLSYATLKNINRNTLTYAFLPGQSLWLNPRLDIPVKACQSLDSASCLQFIKNSPKAKLQWQLEQDFKVFEKKYR